MLSTDTSKYDANDGSNLISEKFVCRVMAQERFDVRSRVRSRLGLIPIRGLPKGLLRGLPRGLPSGLPEGLPRGLPRGLPSRRKDSMLQVVCVLSWDRFLLGVCPGVCPVVCLQACPGVCPGVFLALLA